MKVLIAGATSSLAREIAAEFAQSGSHLLLAARREDEARRIASDLQIRFKSSVETMALDVLDYNSHEDFAQQASKLLQGIDVVLIAVGDMVEQELAEQDSEVSARIINTNLTGCISLVNALSRLMKAQGAGCIVGISSVAGERGRQSNFIYGAAKAGFTTYLNGLRNRLSADNVHVMTVKLGVVDTKMTYGLSRLMLPVSPSIAARAIVKAIERKQDIVFIPWFWQFIMLIIRSIPEPIFKRMKL